MPTAASTSSDRRALLRRVATAYFDGLPSGNMTAVGYADDVVLRTPLADTPITGKADVEQFFAAIAPNIGDTRIIDVFYNDTLTAVCAQAEVKIVSTGKTLAVIDRFDVDAQGRVTAQHNHFDPRPAIG